MYIQTHFVLFFSFNSIFILVSYCWCRYVVCYAQIFLLFFDLFPIFKLSWRTSIPCRHSKKHVAFKKEEEKSRRPHKLFNWSIVCPNKMNMINDIHTWGYFMGLLVCRNNWLFQLWIEKWGRVCLQLVSLRRTLSLSYNTSLFVYYKKLIYWPMV